MSKIREVKQVISPQMVIEGAGVLLRRSFGPHKSNLFDPFLLFDHFAFNDPTEGPIRGFPNHPHRGIETVTYMLDGIVRHRDSLGNAGEIGPGDVQWMTSGRGILHEEMPRRGPNGDDLRLSVVGQFTGAVEDVAAEIPGGDCQFHSDGGTKWGEGARGGR